MQKSVRKALVFYVLFASHFPFHTFNPCNIHVCVCAVCAPIVSNFDCVAFLMLDLNFRYLLSLLDQQHICIAAIHSIIIGHDKAHSSGVKRREAKISNMGRGKNLSISKHEAVYKCDYATAKNGTAEQMRSFESLSEIRPLFLYRIFFLCFPFVGLPDTSDYANIFSSIFLS